MILVESHIIKPSHKHWKEMDHITFLAKNLYNYANYQIRQEFISTSKEKGEGKRDHANWIGYYEIQKVLQNSNQPDYRALPTKVSSQVLMLLDKNWKSFFQATKAYQKNPSDFSGRPSLPKYKHKTKGRCVAIYPLKAISKKELVKNGVVALSGTNIKIKTRQKYDDIKQARIVPLRNGHFKLEVVCEKEVEQHTFDPDKVAGIDLGMNNLASVTSNDGCLQPLLINGRALKSINQYYNKKKAHLQSSLPKGVYNSKKMSQLTHKRNMKIHDFMHKSSRALVDYLVKNEIGKLVIGKNKNWKQNLNIGKKNNQSFTSIPFQKLIDQIIYKASLKGIEVVLTEESYTSKCSFIDMEPLKKQESYKGRRIKRGLFKSSNGTLINADCNGSGNIIRKVFPNAFCLAANQANGIEGVVVRPLKVQYNEFHKLKDSAFSAESF